MTQAEMKTSKIQGFLPWPGGSDGWSVVPYSYIKKVAGSIPVQGTYLGCGFNPPSGCVQEATG